jgi:hypothetical protein
MTQGEAAETIFRRPYKDVLAAAADHASMQSHPSEEDV